MRRAKLVLMVFAVAAVAGFSLAVSGAVLAEEKEVPPGVSKQGGIPGKGSHEGWEKGKHKGWEKGKEIKREEAGKEGAKKEEPKKEKKEKKADAKIKGEGKMKAEGKGKIKAKPNPAAGRK